MRSSIIIPTVNREQELRRLLDSFVIQERQADEIIIVEQGTKQTESLVKTYAQLPITWVFSDVKSLTRARNIGVEKATGDIIGFLDDDIVLDSKYIASMHQFFEKQSNALGVQGIITNFAEGHTQKVGGNTLVYSVYNVLAKFFLLNNSSRKNKLLLSGRNQYARHVQGVTTCEWLSGIGNYRKSVFEKFRFDELLKGYALGEDKFFSYQLHEAHPGSLYIDPAMKCEHHHAQEGRPKDREWVAMRVQYTYYLWKKFFRKRGIHAFAAFWWANLGDLVMAVFSIILRKNKPEFLLWHVQEYWKLIWKQSN